MGPRGGQLQRDGTDDQGHEDRSDRIVAAASLLRTALGPLTLKWGLLAVSGSGGGFYSGNYKAGQHNDREGRKPCEANRVKFGNGSGQR